MYDSKESEVGVGHSPNEKGIDSADIDRRESRHSVGQNVEFTSGQHMQRNIKSRHAQMIAIGGTIGTGLFVGSGQALATAGPGFLFLAYTIMSFMVYGIITSVIEVATYLPVEGCSMAYFATRYVSKSFGFALGWLYFYSFGIIVAYEITAAAIVINYWPNPVHIAVWITIMLIVIIVLNFCPVGIYAEAEFWFAFIKVVMIVGLLCLSFILFWGGSPSNGYDRLGFRYWENGMATKTLLVNGAGGRLTAFIWVWAFSGFSFFFGPELIVYTAGEMRHPRKNLPVASRRFFYRLIAFYVLGAFAIGVICDSTSEGLTSGAGNANASPWVIAIRNAQIDALPSIINAGILSSAWSSGNSYLYMSSRALYSLALQGSAPRLFLRCNRVGTPIYAVGASSLFAFLAYLNCASASGQVFNWFINLTNTAGFTSWMMCCIIYLQFRKACLTQGVTPPYQSKVQPWGARICFWLFFFLLLMNGFTVFYSGNFTASGFLTAYLGIPIFLGIYGIHKLLRGRSDPWLISSELMDITTDVAEVEAQAIMWDSENEAEGQTQKGWVRKLTAVLWG